MGTENYERKELRRLEAEQTKKQNHIRLSHRNRLDGKILLEQYEEVQTGSQADLHALRIYVYLRLIILSVLHSVERS
jgi:hypothetical protein